MLRNTAVAICLLVGCASLASYWLSQRRVLAGERPSWGWLGLAIGTALLMFAAIIPFTLTWVDSIEQVPTADLTLPAIGQPTPARFPMARPTTAPNAREPQSTSARTYAPTTTTEHETEALSAASRTQPSAPSTAYARAVRSHEPIAPKSGDGWNATRCVLAFRQDPAEDRWTLDNECGFPVGIMLATCDDERSPCAGGWRLVLDGMLLPGKAQRSVSLREQTQPGVRVRYIACAIRDPETIAFMAIDPRATPTSARHEALNAAARNDSCVGAVRAGSIDQLFGPDAPLSPHMTR